MINQKDNCRIRIVYLVLFYQYCLVLSLIHYSFVNFGNTVHSWYTFLTVFISCQIIPIQPFSSSSGLDNSKCCQFFGNNLCLHKEQQVIIVISDVIFHVMSESSLGVFWTKLSANGLHCTNFRFNWNSDGMNSQYFLSLLNSGFLDYNRPHAHHQPVVLQCAHEAGALPCPDCCHLALGI